ncbi:PEP-CTERM sorting domain-containing protein [Methyloversatilis sp.]|uniref:PEP-CTERM sorting domain-containing protein n=1 Tax=Methyloversatilis sp. TaxID=2569862 RepID=UPI002733A334|nr:PEP-CTERM sorting domain-containing protein [Methyloversatilis sp.]MDP2867766.1 PEP-CTERM sorting domain-containing protein [Methyloversatilis sp.]MDP3287213.1 PEP-CTERM sorting domain-containing protein [Methyloversatilis sp.]MDP3455469.1 PEP-CTERM sorting domain-containing protein [Methyloversatilis sp.]MDP3577642.1 PEP-CTERM sorting domain-containing protein [Methyloversatilis sp.]
MRDRDLTSQRRVATMPLLALLLALASPSASALQIEFDYTYDTRGFFTDLTTGAPRVDRRALLDLAAAHYSGFADTLSAIMPAEGDQWSVSFLHPSLGGPGVTLNNVAIEADTLRIYVGGSPSAPGVLGFAGTGANLQATGSAAFVNAVMTRGQLNTTGPDASDYATWGGYIWFNASNDWYFGADASGLSPGSPDFLTTATHEIGHILGFGEADSWLAQIDASTGLFIGVASVAAYGGGVPVDRYGSHWAEGTISVRDGLPQETMMDPSTPFGERQLPTALDYAGFADMGWQVSTVPEPGAALMMLVGLGLISRRVRRIGAIRSDL